MENPPPVETPPVLPTEEIPLKTKNPLPALFIVAGIVLVGLGIYIVYKEAQNGPVQ